MAPAMMSALDRLTAFASAQQLALLLGLLQSSKAQSLLRKAFKADRRAGQRSHASLLLPACLHMIHKALASLSQRRMQDIRVLYHYPCPGRALAACLHHLTA